MGGGVGRETTGLGGTPTMVDRGTVPGILAVGRPVTGSAKLGGGMAMVLSPFAVLGRKGDDGAAGGAGAGGAASGTFLAASSTALRLASSSRSAFSRASRA